MKNKSSINKSGNKSEPPIDVKISAYMKVTGKDKFQLARRNTIKTLLIVGLCFIICWSQNEVMYFMYNCGYDINFSRTYFQFTFLMVFLNCTVNPFIYLIKYKDYYFSIVIKSMNLTVAQICQSVLLYRINQ